MGFQLSNGGRCDVGVAQIDASFMAVHIIFLVGMSFVLSNGGRCEVGVAQIDP